MAFELLYQYLIDSHIQWKHQLSKLQGFGMGEWGGWGVQSGRKGSFHIRTQLIGIYGYL